MLNIGTVLNAKLVITDINEQLEQPYRVEFANDVNQGFTEELYLTEDEILTIDGNLRKEFLQKQIKEMTEELENMETGEQIQESMEN